MKITDVKLRFAKHYLFVQVYTDAGIVGLGEAGNWGLAKTRSVSRITTRISCVQSTSAARSS